MLHLSVACCVLLNGPLYLLAPASAAVAISHGCCLPQALGDSLDERPTHSDVQAALTAASKSAVEPLQQQLEGVTAELDAVEARLRGAGQDLLHLKDWQVGLPHTMMKHHGCMPCWWH